MKESRNHGLVSKNVKMKQGTMLSFRMDLAKDLIGDFRQNKKRKVTDILPDLKNDNGHWPRKIQKKGRCNIWQQILDRAIDIWYSNNVPALAKHFTHHLLEQCSNRLFKQTQSVSESEIHIFSSTAIRISRGNLCHLIGG